MASLTEALAMNNKAPTEGADIAGGISEGVKAGVQLATAKEQVESTRAKVDEQKMELAQKQAMAMLNRTKAALFSNNKDIFNSRMAANKAYANSLNIPYDDQAIASIYHDDNLRLTAQKGINTLASGGVLKDPTAVLGTLGNSAELYGVLEQMQYANSQTKEKFAHEDKKVDQQNSQFYADLQNKKEIAMIAAGSKAGKLSGRTKGEEARDVKFAKSYSDFFDAGGAAAVEANLESLKDSLTTLEQGGTTQAEGFVPDKVGDVVFPKSANVRTNITSVLIQGLKDTFGGQLSDGERKAMVESVYVASADPKQNKQRVENFMEKIKAGAQAKQAAGEYFEENGTLKGFKGTKSFNIGSKTINFESPTGSPGKQEASLPGLPPGADPAKARAALQRAQQMKSAKRTGM